MRGTPSTWSTPSATAAEPATDDEPVATEVPLHGDHRTRLLAQRDRVLRRIDGLRHDVEAMIEQVRLDPPDDEHDPDGATVGFERAQAQALASRAVEDLAAVDAALDRVDAGTYGVCARCGGQIATARLDAKPAAVTCIECASP